MPLTQITTSGIANGAVTTAQLAPGAAGGPKITQIQITDSGGTVLDDTAISLSGGYIKITGTGFAAGAQVIVNNVNALSTTFTSTTVLNAQVGPQSAGTYIVYVVNTDGGVAIAVNGLTYSSEPTWVTGSTLPSQLTAVAISIQLSATGATVYTLAAGSTLPSGLSLSSGGLLSGTINVVTETTYSFIVNAIDNELQDSPRTFSLTVNVVIADPFFNLTSLLLPGNGANNATNNTFLDSSTNNFTVTRVGNSTQGNFSPFSQTGWSNYFDGSGDYLTVSANNFSTGGSWTIEAWCYFTNSSQSDTLVNGLASDRLYINWIGTTLYVGDAIVNNLVISNAKPINTWFHIAVVKNGSTYTAYINGTSVGSTTTALQSTTLTTWQIGARTSQSAQVALGYISNLRITTNAVYTANFTPSTTPLTAITGTTLLTCQSNRFIDNSTGNLAITRFGDTRIQAFSPFNPTTAYSAAVVGGSGYFDGSGDYLTLPADAAFDFGTGDFTVECWVYLNTGASSGAFLSGSAVGSTDLVYFDSSLRFGRNNVAWDTTISFTLSPNIWYHVVFIKESGVAKIYVNGSLIGSAANTISYGPAGGTSIVNASRDLSRQFPGYISGYRIVKGTAVYTANFTPPTAPPTAIANTSVLLNFTNDPIADATSKNAVETVGDAKISTVQSKWGGSSIFFDGSDSLSIPPTNLQLNLGARNFTIEMWAYATNVGNFTLFLKSNSYELKTDSSRWVWQINANTNVFVTNGNLTINTWTHVALVRNGTTTTLYLNGTSVASGTSANPNDNTSPLQLGTGSSGFVGYINDFRITNGLARYTSNFTPPTAAFPTQ